MAQMEPAPEELYLITTRCMQFNNLWTVYFDLLSGHYVPSIPTKTSDDIAEPDRSMLAEMAPSLMFLLYSMFYSLVEDSQDGHNAFRVWRKHFPQEEEVIGAVEARVNSFRDDLRLFRNRLGFHGSRTLKHEEAGFGIFNNHSGGYIIETMRLFKGLNASLLSLDLIRQGVSKDDPNTIRKRIDKIIAAARLP